MGLEVSVVEIEVGTLVTVEAAVDLVGGGDAEGVVGVGLVTVIGALLDPYPDIVASAEVGGVFQLRGGIGP